MIKYQHIKKTLMENLSFSDAAESRCLVRTGAEGLDDLIPESVLPKHAQVVGPGCLRYGLALVGGRE